MIRLFETDKGTQIKELRRGTEQTIINHLAFDQDSKLLTCCSAKAKIHIFNIASEGKKSYFSAFSSIVSIAGSEWSFAQFS